MQSDARQLGAPTIGAVFGAVGLILAAPLTSAAVRISGDLARAKAAAMSTPGAAGPEPAATQT